MSEKAILEIQTSKYMWTGILDRFDVVVNDKNIGTYKTGETQRFEVPARSGHIQLKGWIFSTKKLDLWLDEPVTQRFELSHGFGWSISWIAMILFMFLGRQINLSLKGVLLLIAILPIFIPGSMLELKQIG